MPYFLCRVAGDDGRVVTQSLLASSAAECRRHLEGEGRLVLSIKRDWKQLETQGLSFGRKIKDRDFLLFNQELVALLKSGFPILRSLEVIAARARNIFLKELLTEVAGQVKLGKSLSDAFLPHEKEFSTVYTASLIAGERSGNLPGALSRYIQYARVVSQTKTRIRSAMAYPTILIVFAFLLIGLLVNFILPKFADFYQSFEASMPGISRLVMSVSLALNSHWYLVVGLAGLIVLGIVGLRRRPDYRVRLDRAKLRVPYGGPIWLETGLSLFSRTLGLLLEAGISLLSAIGIAIQAVPNAHLVQRLSGVPDSIKNGDSLSDSLAKTEALPPLALDMVRIGESSANLQGMLADMADFYDERIRVKIDTLVSLVEPVVIIFMGLLVAGMLLSVYLPIFNVIKATRF
jgi:type IV pilus assembly protein PilC